MDNTQVAISPDKRDMSITAGLTEGQKYTVSAVKVTGDTVIPKERIDRMLLVKPGNRRLPV